MELQIDREFEQKSGSGQNVRYQNQVDKMVLLTNVHKNWVRYTYQGAPDLKN